MKLAVVTAVWKRPEVFEMFAKGIKKLQEDKDLEIEVFISGSEGEQSRSMVEAHSFHYVEAPNHPLAAKMNDALRLARSWQPDYVLCVGSDDIISVELLDVYKFFMGQKVDYIGFTDCYFYDTTTGKASYWGGYREKWRKGHTCGAGRVLSKNILDKWRWKIWEDKQSHILDNSMQEKLNKTPHKRAIFSLKDLGVYAMDIKSSTNMTPFKLWDNTTLINEEELLTKFDYVWD
jgi:hypothetical protein